MFEKLFGRKAAPAGPQTLDRTTTILQGLAHPNHQQRSAAARAASDFPNHRTPNRDPRVVKALTTVLRDPSMDVQKAAANALAIIGDPSSLPAVLAAFPEALGDHRKNPYETAYEELAEALGVLGGTEAIGLLIEVLRTGNTRERQIVRGPLRKLPGATASVMPLLSDQDPLVRTEAIQHMGAVRAVEAVEKLVELLGDETEFEMLTFRQKVSDHARMALASIGAAARPALEAAVSQATDPMRAQAEKALRELAPQ